MNAKFPTSSSGGLALDAFTLAVEQDLVSLRRRTRARAHELGLDARSVRALSTAAYEAGRSLLLSAGAADAEICIADGPLLQVVLAAQVSDVNSPALQEALRPLPALVFVHTTHEAGRVEITLAVPLGADTIASVPEAAGATDIDDATAGGLEHENEALRASVRELQAELQETNRGVVALYAELDDHAEKLRAAEDRLRVLLDSVQDYAICMISLNGEVQSWNSGAERLFGYTADEIVGRSFSCFYTPADREGKVPEAQLALAREQGRFEAEGLRIRRGGGAFDANVLITVLRDKHGARGFSLVVRDVTQRKRLEDDLRRRAEDLAAANRAKEDFLATLSHELRTPLNAMLGWTRLLRMGKLEGSAMNRALETIERNAHIQEQLIADILDVSRIVTGKLRLEMRAVELPPIVDAALDAVRPAADAKGIVLECDLSPTGTVLGDPDRLQQVLWNLLTNAVKFTPSGGRIDVRLSRVGNSAVIHVTDTGEGITPALLPFIFDRFTQGDASVTRPHGGLGLGLSIVRHIVEGHGGHVQARSDGPGQGATFSVQLPLRVAHDARDRH